MGIHEEAGNWTMDQRVAKLRSLGCDAALRAARKPRAASRPSDLLFYGPKPHDSKVFAHGLSADYGKLPPLW